MTTTSSIRNRFDPNEVDAIFADLNQCHLPGVAVAIAIDGRPVYRKGFGLANMELPITLSPSMRMRIGSTTKHFACLAYMLLCEDGRASLDDQIGKYLPELHEVSRRRTMRELMGHTSGLRDILCITMLLHGTGRRITDKEMVAYYETIDTVDFEPGSRWSYNNGGYMLLTAAIERITGEGLGEVLRKRILDPVGMRDTLLRPWDSDFVPNSATLHMKNQQGEWSRDYMGMEISGPGGMVSTMDDMLRWLKHMDAPIVGSAETWGLMKAPHRLLNGTSTGYGLGLFTDHYRGVETLSHSGGVMGGGSQMIKVPAAGLDISIASNRADILALMLANKVIDACVEGLDPVEEPRVFDKRSAVFVSAASGHVIELSEAGGMQLMAFNGEPPLPVTPDSAGVLQLPAFLSFMQQSLVLEGETAKFANFGNVEELHQVEADTVRPSAAVGRYSAPAIHFTIEVTEAADGPRLKAVGRHGTAEFRLTPLAPHVWQANNLSAFSGGGIVTFAEDGRSLAFSATSRMDRLTFERCD